MKASECFSIGYFTKTHGYKGGLTAKLGLSFLPLVNEIEYVFIEVSGEGSELVPFFFQDISVKSNGKAVVLLEDITSENEARQFVRKELYLPKAEYPELSEQLDYSKEIIGYTVIDKAHGELGKVESVQDNQAQSILVVNDGQNEIMVPIVPEIVLEVNDDAKEIIVNLPDGLLDIYR